MSRVVDRELRRTRTVKTFGAGGEGVEWSIELVLNAVWRVPSTSTGVSVKNWLHTVLSLSG